ncbi:hypothetical protein C4901_07520 [Acidiferrobacter sp. SPIII_3]|nr:hypothetical protein C4901_07520 [Acidiferrobacter sp. SPIII_3]
MGIPIHVCHFPPGTSKWNKIEHRMFCHITQNWRGRPLVSHEVIINLIANTTTQAGLKIRAELDRAHYPVGIKVTDAELSYGCGTQCAQSQAGPLSRRLELCPLSGTEGKIIDQLIFTRHLRTAWGWTGGR